MKTKANLFFLCLLFVAGIVPCLSRGLPGNSKFFYKKTFIPDSLESNKPVFIEPNSIVDFCSFYKSINTGITFTNSFNSVGVVFQQADFRYNKFKRKPDFTNSIFEDTADFTNVDFETEASFNHVTFKKDCHFVLARINDEIDFTDATFGRVAFFYSLNFDAQMKGLLTFTNASLPDTIDLSDNPYLPRQIEFTDANFNDSTPTNEGGKKARLHYIYLNRTDISKIHIDYKHFRLCLSSPIHEVLSNEEKATCYEGLLKSFKDHNQTESYEALDIEYKNWQSQNNFWTWINGWWWQYGYEKGRVLLWTIGFLILFSLINVCLYDVLFDTYQIDTLSKIGYVFSKNPFIKGLQLYKFSFIYTTLIFSKLGIDFNKIKVNNWITLSLIAIEYLIGLICTGCLVNWVLSK